MVVCHRLLVPIEIVLRTIVEVITWVIRTVCEWVSTVITTLKEVVEEVCEWVEEKVCKWLPWPLDKLCEWVNKLVCTTVTKVIEVVETVWDWVCEEVLERIITLLEIIVTYVIYILRWVCFLIDLPWRVIAGLWCLLGFQGPKFLRVCVVILADAEGNEALSVAEAQAAMAGAARIFRQCNIRLIVDSVRVVRQPRFLTGTTCNFGGMFSAFFVWFSQQARPGCVTVYFVQAIDGACGCAYPGANWVTVAAPGDGCSAERLDCVVAQELGHLADIWPHSDDAGENVMANPCGREFTDVQCCIIRTSRIVTNTPGLFLGTAIGALRPLTPEE